MASVLKGLMAGRKLRARAQKNSEIFQKYSEIREGG
jgi:hypothetical protein